MKGKFLVMLQALYLETSIEVKISEKQSDHFPVSTGLRQGCVLSPLLFSLYINGLIVELKLKRCGVECGGLLPPGLLFAMTLLCLVLWCWRNGVQDRGPDDVESRN